MDHAYVSGKGLAIAGLLVAIMTTISIMTHEPTVSENSITAKNQQAVAKMASRQLYYRH